MDFTIKINKDNSQINPKKIKEKEFMEYFNEKKLKKINEWESQISRAK